MMDRSPFEDNLPQLLIRIWSRRTLLIRWMAAGFLVGLCLSLLLKPHYQATMIVGPTDNEKYTTAFISNDEGDVAPQKNIIHPTDSNFIRFEQSLRGFRVASLLFQMDDVRTKLEGDSLWRGFVSSLKVDEDLALYLENHIKIEPVGSSNNLKITYRHPDPAFAARLLMLLRKANDQLIRNQDKEAAIKRIDWFKDALKKSFNPDHRQALARMLMVDERRVMVLSLDQPYAAQVIEEAAAWARPVVPRPMLYIVVCTLLGALLGAAAVVMRDMQR